MEGFRCTGVLWKITGVPAQRLCRIVSSFSDITASLLSSMSKIICTVQLVRYVFVLTLCSLASLGRCVTKFEIIKITFPCIVNELLLLIPKNIDFDRYSGK